MDKSVGSQFSAEGFPGGTTAVLEQLQRRVLESSIECGPPGLLSLLGGELSQTCAHLQGTTGLAQYPLSPAQLGVVQAERVRTAEVAVQILQPGELFAHLVHVGGADAAGWLIGE
ncbi:hypothetical protein [Nocardia transvalensis]|uniref:hypothetical protein n=1 Tax=Nocardia transvalensis TaxID=37333 RepID=UPI0018945EE2|nr:hypothetical protein [Nocardia transvalensis]MBF6330070.1 hypothetical protein [Nocardia transvalensis]